MADAGYDGYYNFVHAKQANSLFLTKGKVNMAGRIKRVFLDGVEIPCEGGEVNFLNQKVSLFANYRPGHVLEFEVEFDLKNKSQSKQELPSEEQQPEEQQSEEQQPKTVTLRVVRVFKGSDGDVKAKNFDAKKLPVNWLITNLPRTVPFVAICALYRIRWQIELAFKNLKSLNNFRAAKTKSQALTESFVWLSLISAQIKFLAIRLAELKYKVKLSPKACNKLSVATITDSGWCKRLCCLLFGCVLDKTYSLAKITTELASSAETKASPPSTKNLKRSLTTQLQLIVEVLQMPITEVFNKYCYGFS